jgi:hypothetical protein
MVSENVPLPVKVKAKECVLRRLPRTEQDLLKSLRWRAPVGSYERDALHDFLRAMRAECDRLEYADHWSASELVALLSRAQTRALKDAMRQLGWTNNDMGQTLKLAFRTLVTAKHDQWIGIQNREELSLTHWTEWKELQR